ncbi:MAG TPA: hypothetical protein PLX17_01385 [Chitinophagaceae bacterium]|nr:hypothetical protein [Chitinophagaceae bacterium]HRC16064.1 hypothetical protein [Bacteroidia bacterium]
MAATVKTLLPNTETEIFYNWNDLYGSEVKAVNITLCNTSNTDVKVHLGFVVPSGLFIAGAVLSFATVPANDTITIEVTDRIISTDESIRAWAEVPNVISLSVDLVGDINQTDIEPIVLA